MNELQKQTLLADLSNTVDFDISLLSEEQLTNYFNTVDKLDKAQKSIDWFNKFVSKLDGYGLYDMHDLKLYDLSYHIYKNSDKYGAYDTDLFSQFCGISFTDYEDWLSEEFGKYAQNTHHDFVDHIGRTSSFVFKDFDLDTFLNDYLDYNMNSGLYDNDLIEIEFKTHFSDNNLPTNYNINLLSAESLFIALTDSVMDRYGNDETDVIDNFNEFLKEVNDDLDYLIDNLLIDYKEAISRSLKVYNYIRLFKNHQVENFEMWFENNSDWLDNYKK